jgi:hypothetical protein
MVANNQLVASADKALQASLSALWTTIIPLALRPLAYPVLRALPSKQIKRLHTHRARLFGAAMVIAKNAFKRLGSEFKDEIGMTKAFMRPDTKEILDLYADKEPIPGSVIDLLVRARNKQTGEPFKTHQIVAQANTVMVGGHDTTGFTLTAALFFLATNPEAQAKLVREIDAFGRDRVVTRADLPDLKYMNVRVGGGWWRGSVGVGVDGCLGVWGCEGGGLGAGGRGGGEVGVLERDSKTATKHLNET